MPPKKTKSVPKQKGQAADALVTRSVGGKRKRVEAYEPTRGRREKAGKKAKLEEVLYFRLLDVSEDVLYEICSYLHPLILLHLSRTCKGLRQVLMNEASRYAWRTSFESILLDGIRDVRSDICEPRLANLLFDDCCDGCQKSRKGKIPQFMLRMNMCYTCLYKSTDLLTESEFEKAAATVTTMSKLDGVDLFQRIQRFIPSEPLSGNYYAPELYDRASFVEIIGETKDLTKDEFDEWSKRETENFESLKDECKQLKEFKIYMDEEAKLEKAEKKHAICIRRREDVVARFKKAGYVTKRPDGNADEVFWNCVMSNLHGKPLHYRRMITGQSPLTEREWKQGKMLQCLIDTRMIVEGDKSRTAGEKKECARGRAKASKRGTRSQSS